MRGIFPARRRIPLKAYRQMWKECLVAAVKAYNGARDPLTDDVRLELRWKGQPGSSCRRSDSPKSETPIAGVLTSD